MRRWLILGLMNDQLQPDPADETNDLVRRASQRAEASLADAQDAFESLYRMHARQLTAWLSSRVNKSDVDDIHNEIWIRVWEKLPSQFAGGSFRGWLFTIARNHLIDTARRKNTRKKVGHDGPDDNDMVLKDPDGDEPWQVLAAEERGQMFRSCLDKLDTGRHRVIVGRLGGEDYANIASDLGITTAQAQSWLFVAKRLLHDCLQATGA